MIVSVWQDVFMEQSSVEVEPPAVRNVNEVEVLKALADPTRLAIISALMKSGGDLPIMSVKELAAELGEPQTKLYRHVRQLEAVGLIRVASTRVVSGILEQRYQACQRDFTLDRGFLREHVDESQQAMQAVLDLYREGFFAAFRADKSPAGEDPAAEDYTRPLMFMCDLKVSPARAAELRGKLQEIMDSLKDDRTEDPDGVTLNLLIGCYVPVEETGR
jgi:DNA-binding transcriptional ArsR family regulator